jgi:hypothetical protein
MALQKRLDVPIYEGQQCADQLIYGLCSRPWRPTAPLSTPLTIARSRGKHADMSS